MFGFLCNLYDQMALRPEPMALFTGALSSMMSLVSKQVGLDFGIACFSTAFAANCTYCSAHGADLGMKYAGKTPEHIKDLYDFLQQRKPLGELPFDDKLKATINLSARMTTQTISREDIEDFAPDQDQAIERGEMIREYIFRVMRGPSRHYFAGEKLVHVG